MSLSADQREAIAYALYKRRRPDDAVVDPRLAKLATDEALKDADALAALVDGWLGEARRDEQERLLTEAQRRVDHAQRGRDSWPDSDYWRGLREGLALLRNDLRDALGVIEGSEASDNQGADDD